MAVVAKKDIQTLTKQLILDKNNILENIKQEYIVIDPALLSENFSTDYKTKLSQLNAIHNDETMSDERNSIPLDELETIVERFDNLDKKLSELKAPKAATITRKENSSMKRYGSMADINKTLVRSQSSQSLNSTKTFNEPTHVAAPKQICNQNSTFASNTNNNDIEIAPKLSADEISKHNAMGKEIEMRLNSDQQTEKNNQICLSDISQMYKSSFERLNKFCEEVQKIQTSRSTDSDNDTSLMGLDQNLLDLMEKLNKALFQIHFIAENQNIYTTGIKGNNTLLSDDLTDILEHFYRVNI